MDFERSFCTTTLYMHVISMTVMILICAWLFLRKYKLLPCMLCACFQYHLLTCRKSFKIPFHLEQFLCKLYYAWNDYCDNKL